MSKGTTSGTPPVEGTPPTQTPFKEQMNLMFMILESQRDLAALSTKNA